VKKSTSILNIPQTALERIQIFKGLRESYHTYELPRRVSLSDMIRIYNDHDTTFTTIIGDASSTLSEDDDFYDQGSKDNVVVSSRTKNNSVSNGGSDADMHDSNVCDNGLIVAEIEAYFGSDNDNNDDSDL